MQSDNNEKLQTMRHSAAHVLAAAVKKLYPGTKLGIGPAIENGFYYDFDFEKPISQDDFPKIEKGMQKIIAPKLPFLRVEISAKEAREIFKDEPYKVELIADIEKESMKDCKKCKECGEPCELHQPKISIYRTGDFVDLCLGPHIADTSRVGPFKLLSLAGAYWKGSEKNKMLTRIYGTAFETKKELEEYLKNLEEAKKRDHKKLGRQLGLFIIPEEIGSGLVILLPNGATIRREIEKFIIEEQIKRGYQHVYSPHIGKKDLWVTSGHWDLYRDKMYSAMKIDKDEYLVKPMNCPMHIMVYKENSRSYRDLPLRVAEIATVYRYEQSGELTGLSRVRHITQDDAHIFCAQEQVKEEFMGVIDYALYILKTFGIKDFEIWLSTRDPKNKDKYLGDDRVWQQAEEEIKKAVSDKSLKFIEKEGEAAFYGPKVDIIIKDALGRGWQCTTIQLDFMLPERFKLSYIDKTGTPQPPVIIHRAILGAIERFLALLIEHYAGAFPLWLSPVQAVVIPISDKHLEYAQKIKDELLNADIRVELDSRSETMQAKIRDWTLQKVPYMIIIGDKEIKRKRITVRTRDGKNLPNLNLEEFLAKLKKEIKEKS